MKRANQCIRCASQQGIKLDERITSITILRITGNLAQESTDGGMHEILASFVPCWLSSQDNVFCYRLTCLVEEAYR